MGNPIKEKNLKLNLSPRTQQVLQRLKLPLTDELESYSEEDLLEKGIPKKSIRDIKEALDDIMPKQP